MLAAWARTGVQNGKERSQRLTAVPAVLSNEKLSDLKRVSKEKIAPAERHINSLKNP
jgi:hypothetical protein